MFIKVLGNTTGLVLPIVTAYFLSLFAFGQYELSTGGNCFAVEHPDTKQYSQNPIDSDKKNYIGLKVVNVTERLQQIAQVGFGLECVIALLVIANLAAKVPQIVQTLVGYASLGWFGYLIFARYDHYGKVCAGDYATSTDVTSFTNLQLAGQYTDYYLMAIWAIVIALFTGILFYSCCVDPTRRSADDVDEDEKE